MPAIPSTHSHPINQRTEAHLPDRFGQGLLPDRSIDLLLTGFCLRHDPQQRAGPTEIAPVNGRSCAKIKNTDAATPVAKSPIATAAASRLSLWTMAIAISAQAACKNRADYLTKLTSDLLIRIRCRRASNAFSSAVVISRCAVF